MSQHIGKRWDDFRDWVYKPRGWLDTYMFTINNLYGRDVERGRDDVLNFQRHHQRFVALLHST